MLHFRSMLVITVIENSRHLLHLITCKVIACMCLLIPVNEFSYKFIGRISYPIYQHCQKISSNGVTQKIMCGFTRLINTFLPFIILTTSWRAQILIVTLSFKFHSLMLAFFCLEDLTLKQQHSMVLKAQNLKADSQGSNLIQATYSFCVSLSYM